MTDDHRDAWRIGELADSTGLTVRTLHHYDQIGLLRPSKRTASGHRCYGRDDATRLYQIVALRELGLSLETVKEVLTERPPLEPILDAHLKHVEQRLSAIRALRDRLLVVVAASRATPEVSTDDVLQLIQEVNNMEKIMKSYFSDEQLETLARRNEESAGALAASREEWPELVSAVQAHVEAGTDPAAPEVQQLARRWMTLLENFHGGDSAMRDSLYRMYAENSDTIQQSGGPSPELIEYIRRANASTGRQSPS